MSYPLAKNQRHSHPVVVFTFLLVFSMMLFSGCEATDSATSPEASMHETVQIAGETTPQAGITQVQTVSATKKIVTQEFGFSLVKFIMNLFGWLFGK